MHTTRNEEQNIIIWRHYAKDSSKFVGKKRDELYRDIPPVQPLLVKMLFAQDPHPLEFP
jgi:hypothetical protein